jgi:hypothetical protein
MVLFSLPHFGQPDEVAGLSLCLLQATALNLSSSRPVVNDPNATITLFAPNDQVGLAASVRSAHSGALQLPRAAGMPRHSSVHAQRPRAAG